MLQFIKRLSVLIFIAFFLVLIAIAGIYYTLAPNLPSPNVLKQTPFQVPLRIFSAEGKLIAEFGE